MTRAILLLAPLLTGCTALHLSSGEFVGAVALLALAVAWGRRGVL